MANAIEIATNALPAADGFPHAEQLFNVHGRRGRFALVWV